MTAGARSAASSRAAGLALVAISGAAFGTLAISARYAYGAGGDPLGVLAWRFGIAAAVLAGIMALRRERWPRGPLLVQLAALGGGYVAQSLAFFTALQHASAGLVSLLLYLYPGIVTALSVAFLGERLTAPKCWALGLAVVGSACAVGPALSGEPLGIALGVISALCYSVYVTLGSAVTPRAGALPSTAVILTTAAVVYAALAVATGAAVPSGAAGVASLAALAVVGTVVPVLTFFAGMALVGPTETASLSAFEPAVTVVLAALLFGERLTPLQLLGGALVLAAVVVLARVGPTTRVSEMGRAASEVR